MALSRSSVSKSQCDSNRNEIHLSSSHVRGKISMQATRIRTKQNRDEVPCTRARPPACRIKAQQTSNTSSHAKQHAEACPPVRHVVIPHRTNRRIDPLWAHTSPRIRARNPAERLSSTASSWGKREYGEREREKIVPQEGLMGKRDRVVSLRVRSSGTSALGILDI